MQDIRFIYCSECRVNFPMTEKAIDTHERSGKEFYCSEGHALVIRQNDIVTQLRASARFLSYSDKQVSRLTKQIECMRGVITRQRNRLLRGDCPYCSKSAEEIGKQGVLRHIRERHDKSEQK